MVKYNENKCVKPFFFSVSLSIFFDDLIPNFRRSTAASGNVAMQRLANKVFKDRRFSRQSIGRTILQVAIEMRIWIT